MNVVYPIRNIPTSADEDLLLRYSLRSLDKHGENIGKVYMVGARRAWFSNQLKVIDLDLYGVGNKDESKFSRVGSKLKEVAKIGEPFLLMNDDFILCEKYITDRPEWFYCGTVSEILNDPRKGLTFKNMLLNTCEHNDNPPEISKNYATHTPFLVDDPALAESIPLCNSRKSVTSFRQFYAFKRGLVGNPIHQDTHTALEEDVKFYARHNVEQWLEHFKSNKFVSFNLTAVNSNLFIALHELFPEPSKYEKR